MELLPILVTWDFTNVSAHALEHAVRMSNMSGKNIVLLHIIKNNNSEDTVFEQLKSVSKECKRKHGIEPKIIVKAGNIFTTISETANNIQAKLIVMGTHGYSGIQKIIGSRVKRVLSKSNAPFFIVQAPPKQIYLKRIIFPIDSNTEMKENVSFIINLANLYRSEVIIFKNITNNLKFDFKTNLTSEFIVNNLQSNKIYYSEQIHNDRTNFYKAAIDLVGKKQADLIAITTNEVSSLKDYFYDTAKQQLVANCHKVPVICFNPRRDNIHTI
ncbi:MAG TPA: universal stress protein [Salinivirgaceae bacterium]|nr:universal stress protein [Salinivirgaceae bacterium]